MQNEIRDILDHLIGTGSRSQTTAGQGADFEMWLLLRIAERLASAPFQAVLHDHACTAIAPGGMFSLGATGGKIGNGPAGHVHFDWRGVEFEIHANIEYRGRSGEAHEIDLGFIQSSVAAHLRTSPAGGRPTGRPRLAIECKFKPGTGSKDEARQTVARLFDLHFLAGHQYPSSGARPSVWPEASIQYGVDRRRIYYQQSFNNCFNAICRIGGVSQNTGAYLAFNGVAPYRDLRPGHPSTDAFLDEVEAFLASQ